VGKKGRKLPSKRHGPEKRGALKKTNRLKMKEKKTTVPWEGGHVSNGTPTYSRRKKKPQQDTEKRGKKKGSARKRREYSETWEKKKKN